MGLDDILHPALAIAAILLPLLIAWALLIWSARKRVSAKRPAVARPSNRQR